MNPSSDPTSSFEALRQLKTLLDQGALTQAEYDTLKQRLLNSAGLAAPAGSVPTEASPAPTAPAYPPPAAAVVPAPAPPSSSGELPSLLDMFQQAPTAPLSPAPAPAPYQRPAPPPAEYVAPAPKIVPLAPVVVAPPVAPEVSFLPGTPTLAPALPVPDFVPTPRPVVPAQADFLAPPVASSSPYQAPPTPQPTSEPAFSTLLDSSTPAEPYRTAAPPVVESEADFGPVAAAPASRALPTVLLVLGGLALLLVLGYLFLGRDQTDEHLTSRSQTAADSVAVRPETGPQDEQLTLPPATEPEVVRTPPVAPAAGSATTDSVANAAKSQPAATSQPDEEAVFPSRSAAAKPGTDKPATDKPAAEEAVFPTPAPTGSSAPAATEPTGPATAPEDGDDEATASARQALGRYYADLQAAPFNAPQHFAPTVERLYTRQNLTPAAIEAELNRSMFPEFKQMNTRIVPGTLRVGPPAADGTRTATYTEQSRAFRVSKNQYQRTRTQVRVRFNPEFKMTYLRQEKLLENTFE